MVTPDERRALVFLAVVAAVGAVFRATRPEPTPGAGVPGVVVAPELGGGDLAAQAARSRRAEELARPLAPGERVDVDRASAEELDRLPGVGPALASRIVADRQTRGPFGSLAALDRVAGVGPHLLGAIESRVSFSGVPFSSVTGGAGAGAAGALARPAPGGARDGLRPSSSARRDECPPVVAVNRADTAQLACLPGLGPVLAARIVAERRAHGAFRDLADLARVPGLGPARIARLSGRLRLP